MLPLERALVPSYPVHTQNLRSGVIFDTNAPMIQGKKPLRENVLLSPPQFFFDWNSLGIGEEVEVLNSLQRPKKILFFGSDGISNHFLCKPKDDLRKDSRVMEFNSMINVFLRRSDQARKRELCKLGKFRRKTI